MEIIQRGGRPTVGFGVGAPFPQSTYVKPAMDGPIIPRPTGKVAAFLGGAVASGIAGVAATALFGDGSGLALGVVGQRLAKNWKILAATAAAGGIVGAIAK
jgi:hypothetical protein